jgi:hypothetical protein
LKKSSFLLLLLLLLLLGLISFSLYSQNVTDIKLSIQQETPLATALTILEKSHSVKFFYGDDWLDPFYLTEAHNGQTLQTALEDVLKNSGIEFSLMFGYAVIFVKDPTQALAYQSMLQTAVEEKKVVEKIIIGSKTKSLRKTVALSGIVRDDLSKALLSEVVVLVDNATSIVSDSKGHFSLNISPGLHVITFQLPSYRQKVVDLEIYESGSVDILLEDNPTILEEIEITDQAIVTRGIGQSSIKMVDLKRAPTFLGEADLIKQVQNQPGVTTVGEVATGFNVRGGGVDQNLVLYDGVPIFNTSHALGFFTAFNSDAIENVSFYRGGIPAEYGGRLSSVLDIKSKEGNPLQWKGTGGVGIISSYLTFGGPIKKDTTTFIASFRTSYSDWMLNLVKSNYLDLRKSAVSFYDGSFKLAHKFTNKSKLTFSGYTSHDDYKIRNDTLFSTRNIATALKYDQILRQNFFVSATLSYGEYSYTISDQDVANAFKLKYDIMHPSLKIDFLRDGDHKISFGLHNTYYVFSPGSMEPTTLESDARSTTILKEHSIETALYLQDEFDLTEKLKINGGLRFSIYNRTGPGTVYSYKQGEARELRNVEDSVTYGTGDVMKTYSGLEPRVSLQYQINEFASIKVGYNRMYQYLHLVTNTAAVTPIDVWQSSNAHFRPQISDQFSAGYYKKLHRSSYEAYTEVFYKTAKNALDFKDGSRIILNKNMETALVSGTAEAYGGEFSIAKVKGRLLGTLNYTYSRSLRKIQGLVTSETINNGNYYPTNYDQPHVTNMNWRYGISRRIFFSGNFTYHTGRPISLPGGKYFVDGIPVQDFSERNKYRIPDYHRLDLAFIIESTHKIKKIDGTWVISFYNVYARKNAYAVFFQDDGTGSLVPYKLSVIGTIIPSVSYSFKF